MSGFDVLQELQKENPLSEVPVIVFTGRNERGGRRSIAYDGAQHCREGRRVARAPAGRDGAVPASRGNRAAAREAAHLQRLNSSDEDLVGRKVLLVDDDARNIFALSSVLERHGMRVLTSTTDARLSS